MRISEPLPLASTPPAASGGHPGAKRVERLRGRDADVEDDPAYGVARPRPARPAPGGPGRPCRSPPRAASRAAPASARRHRSRFPAAGRGCRHRATRPRRWTRRAGTRRARPARHRRDGRRRRPRAAPASSMCSSLPARTPCLADGLAPRRAAQPWTRRASARRGGAIRSLCSRRAGLAVASD